MRTELYPNYDSRKSFYGKAIVETEPGKPVDLYSYGTLVARIDYAQSPTIPQVFGTYSATTLRHIKEFLKQNHFTADNKTQIINDYIRNDI